MGLSDLDCKMSHVIQANVTLRSCCGDSDEKIFRNRVSHTRMQSLRGMTGGRSKLWEQGSDGIKK